MSIESSQLGVAIGSATSRRRPSFFFAAHLLLLAVVLVGFAPTFYLRSVFHHASRLPGLLYAHGSVLTGWFLLTVAQGWLIHTRRLRWHRRLGYFAAGYAALVILFGTLATLRMISELDSAADGENIIVWGNFFSLVMFAAFVSLAVVFRGKPEAHRRLILLASMSIVGPALARFPMWPIFAGGLDAAKNYAIGGLLTMFALMLTYDVITRKKPHPASWSGMLAILTSLAAAVLMAVSGIGYHILRG